MYDLEAAHDIISQHLSAWIKKTNLTPINKDVDEFLKSTSHSLDALSELKIAAFIYNYEQGNYTYFNDYFAELMQSNREYIIKHGIQIMQERVHPDDFIKCLDITQRTLAEFAKMKEVEKESTQLRLFFRIKKETGEYSWVMQCNKQVKWCADFPPLDLAYITELFNEHHSMRVLAVLQTNNRLIEILPENETAHFTKLSSREVEVLQLIRIGLNSNEISEKLQLSANTIKTHRRNILKKLQVKNMQQAIRHLN
jgi:DNA-binding CsgD family transcriptional regulator/PAS domain-containing protein